MKYIRLVEISSLALGFIILGIGITFLMSTNLSVATVSILLGLAIALDGVSLILGSAYTKTKSSYALFELSLGCLLCVLGAIILINSNLTLGFLGAFVIIVAILSLLNQAVKCYERSKAGLEYSIAVILGLIHGVFGILVIYSVYNNAILFNTLIGTYLLILGVFNIVTKVHPRIDSELV